MAFALEVAEGGKRREPLPAHDTGDTAERGEMLPTRGAAQTPTAVAPTGGA